MHTAERRHIDNDNIPHTRWKYVKTLTLDKDFRVFEEFGLDLELI